MSPTIIIIWQKYLIPGDADFDLPLLKIHVNIIFKVLLLCYYVFFLYFSLGYAARPKNPLLALCLFTEHQPSLS